MKRRGFWCHERDGTKIHYVGGIIHNETGPAKILADGTKEWWFNGVCLSQTNYEKYLKLKVFW